MSLFDSIGNFFSSEGSHVSDLLSSFGKTPGKTLAQFALGAEDPLGAKLWSGVTGAHFTPSVGQMGGETDAQFAKSRDEGHDTGMSQTLGRIANVVAAVWGGAEAGGALGGASGGGSGGAAAAGEGGTSAAAADGGSVNLFADAVPGAGGDVGATAGGAGNGTAAAAGSGSSATSSWMSYGKTAATAIAPSVVSSLLAPKPPKTKAPTAMPDPLAQQQAQQQKLIQQLARRGRASTILTSPGSAGGSLGG